MRRPGDVTDTYEIATLFAYPSLVLVRQQDRYIFVYYGTKFVLIHDHVRGVAYFLSLFFWIWKGV